MKTPDEEKKDHRPKNKATMDQPQEEFIEPESKPAERDVEHGDELPHAGQQESGRK